MDKEEIIKNVNKVLNKIAKSIKEYPVEIILERYGEKDNESFNILMKSKVNNGYEIEGCAADYYGHKEWDLKKIIESKEEQEKWKNEWITNLRKYEKHAKKRAIAEKIEDILEEMVKILEEKNKKIDWSRDWLLRWDIDTLIYRLNKFKRQIWIHINYETDKIALNRIEFFIKTRIKDKW